MPLRNILYQLLVNRVPEIRRRYQNLRMQKKGRGGKYYAWTAVLGMNLLWIVKKDILVKDNNGKKLKKLPHHRNEISESLKSHRESPEVLADRLAEYDIISFDVFDTLLFRQTAHPSDLFYFTGEKLRYLDFERLRRESEWEARQEAFEKTGRYEVTLGEIYERMEKRTGIPHVIGITAELETERELCFANPYLLNVVKILAGRGKRIICISDMYLPSAVIRNLVENCGFSGITDYFVSCEYSAAKGDGSLYNIVRKKLGWKYSYAHIGDNPVSDLEQAEKKKFHAELYYNVNTAGMRYRSGDLSVLTGTLYCGTVNAHLHNGSQVFTRAYELGYIYGGLFVLGYCQFIHEYVRNHDIDKILFLSRDGDILHQIYTMLYPQEESGIRTEYVYWSRLAAAKLGAGYYKYDYFRRFVRHKKNKNYTMRQIFESMELDDMLPGFCSEFPQFTAESVLIDGNDDIVEEFLSTHWNEVIARYQEQSEAGKHYYSEILKGCKKVCAVDVGWAGSGAVILNYVVNQIWKLNCEVIGLVAGTNSANTEEPNISEAQLYSGKMAGYLYSQEHNRDLWKFHDDAKGHNLVLEFLLGSEQGSFRKFVWDSKKQEVNFECKKNDRDVGSVIEIQAGIKDFVHQFPKIHNVSGRDAYAVLMPLLQDKKFINSICKKMEINL